MTHLFSRALAIIYGIAFVSFGVQVAGLIGPDGILPAGNFLEAVHRQLGASAYWQVPTLLWLGHSEFALQALCWTGAALALVALVAPAHGLIQRLTLALLYIFYLSLVSAGQDFMGYQWDALLLETGFFAIFLKADRLRILLFQFLLFRLIFESGAVKLTSHDETWRNLTALSYHWETQPLPTPLAWYLSQAPMWFQKASCALVFVIELALPFLMFGPRKLQCIAAAGVATLQILILLTGNYTFFNLLTIALCLFLLPCPKPGSANRYVSMALIAFTGTLGLAELAVIFGFYPPQPVRYILMRTAPFELVNQYGLFASMTTKRDEISIEGSNDGENWSAYTFRDKPEPLGRAPRWVAPHQPRLDWQMWFAALQDPQQLQWFQSFFLKLLRGSPPVLALLEHDPFQGKPPKYLRALVYQYHFTSAGSRDWWKRELRGIYFPAVSLK